MRATVLAINTATAVGIDQPSLLKRPATQFVSATASHRISDGFHSNRSRPSGSTCSHEQNIPIELMGLSRRVIRSRT